MVLSVSVAHCVHSVLAADNDDALEEDEKPQWLGTGYASRMWLNEDWAYCFNG